MVYFTKLLFLTLLIFYNSSSGSYALPNKWCSNGMNDKNVLPSPKPSFNKCPQNASVEMNLREVEKYYLNGSGQEYLCNLVKNPLFFLAGQTKNQRKEIKNLRKIFLYKQDDVRKSCDKIKKTKFAKKKAEEAKQKAKANVNKEPKEWCSNGMNDKNILPSPKPKFNNCPPKAKVEMNLREVEKYYLNGGGQEYLCDLNKKFIFVGGPQQRDDYKAIKEMFLYKQDLVNSSCNELEKTKIAKQKAKDVTVIVVAQEAPKTELSQNKAKEDEARKKAIADKKVEDEAAKQEALAQKKAKALAAKKAKEDAIRKKASAKKKAEELAKQKALAEKKAKEKARKKALAQKKAKEDAARKKAIAAKKAEEEALKQKVLNEKVAKIKDEAQFIVATLKEYVTTDSNKLDILEVSDLLENYNSEKQKGWSDKTVERYEELYNYVQKDDGFTQFSAEKKSKQLAAYNEEIIQLREYLTTSQSDLKAFITKNLGSKNAKQALKLAKQTKQILKDFEISKALLLGNNIATWKAMNGVAEDKNYTFKLLNKKEDEARKKVLEKKKVEERKKAIAAQKAKKEKDRKKALAEKKAKEQAKQKATAFKKTIKTKKISNNHFISPTPRCILGGYGGSQKQINSIYRNLIITGKVFGGINENSKIKLCIGSQLAMEITTNAGDRIQQNFRSGYIAIETSNGRTTCFKFKNRRPINKSSKGFYKCLSQ
jgi:hypothetical protein